MCRLRRRYRAAVRTMARPYTHADDQRTGSQQYRYDEGIDTGGHRIHLSGHRTYTNPNNNLFIYGIC